MMLIEFYHQIILILGESVLLGEFELGYEVLDIYGVDAKILECRSDEDFVLYERHEFQVDIMMIHVKFICW